jgi:hypothetical protein
MIEIVDVRVALNVSMYRKKILARIKTSLIVMMISRPDGNRKSNAITLINDWSMGPDNMTKLAAIST